MIDRQELIEKYKDICKDCYYRKFNAPDTKAVFIDPGCYLLLLIENNICKYKCKDKKEE